ncbi:MAG: cytochrome c [Proteobacteria bacterium]|nr:cytochrome c [Pseudomonadota bacterium]
MNVKTIAAALAALCAPLVASVVARAADPATIARGKYLVTLASCNDCHTPGYFLGKPDTDRYLGGSDVGFELPGLGVFLGPNLTPDRQTGLGNWTDAQIIAAIQTGARPDGRMLAPIMPYRAFTNLTPQDAQAIVAFLRSIPPVQHKVEGPFGPNEKANVYTMKVVRPPNVPEK